MLPKYGRRLFGSPSARRPLQAASEGVWYCRASHAAGGLQKQGPWLPRRRLVYGAHFYDGFYVQPLWQLLGEGVTCALMTGFLDSRVAVLLNEVRRMASCCCLWPCMSDRPFILCCNVASRQAMCISLAITRGQAHDRNQAPIAIPNDWNA